MKMVTMPETTSQYVKVSTGPHKIQKMLGKNVMPPPQTMAAQIKTSERSYETLKSFKAYSKKATNNRKEQKFYIAEGYCAGLGSS
jgi:hypothetical protein